MRMDYDLMYRYISGKASAKDKERFEAWLKESADHEKQYTDWAAFWEATGKIYMDYNPDTEARWKELESGLGLKSNKKLISRSLNPMWYGVAAAVMLLVLFWVGRQSEFSQHFNLFGDKYTTYTTENDTMTVFLADGSIVCLNEESELKVPNTFTKYDRNVVLQGEAYFKVAKDTRHLFRVFAQSSVTEVLGTSFNVKSHGPNVRVTLVSGQVAFFPESDTSQRLLLKPGQHALYREASDQVFYDSASGMNNLAWYTGRLEFRQTPMSEVCATLSEYYNFKIIWVDSEENNGNFTGAMVDLNLKEALGIIELTMGVNSEVQEDRILLSYPPQSSN